MSAAEFVDATRAILDQKAVLRLEEPVELASGQLSSFFVDGKAGLAEPADLQTACRAMHELIVEAGIDYDAVGGLTLGADHLCVGMSIVGGRRWFFVRKEPKGRGTGKQIEGATVEPGVRVVVVEDAVSTGGSILKAIDVIAATGAEIVAACTLIDRGDHLATVLGAKGIPYFPVTSYRDFDMPPVDGPA